MREKCTAFINGRIYTVNDDNPWAEAIIVAGEKITFVGSSQEAEQYINSADEIIDLEGAFVMPSFYEAHAHCNIATKRLYSVNLAECKSEEEYLETIKEYVENHPGMTFIDGTGWKNPIFSEHGPTKEGLDKITRDVPIILQSEDIHSLWVNSKALEMARVDKNTPDPEGTGIIERYENGEPSGCLRETARDLVEFIRPDYTIEQYQSGTKEFAKSCAEYGITGSMDAMVFPDSNMVAAMSSMDEDEGLPFYLSGALRAYPEKGISQIADYRKIRERAAHCPGYRINTIKIVIDGVIEGGTGYLYEPYEVAAGKGADYYGSCLWPRDVLNEVITEADKYGFQVHIHAIGDRATGCAIEAFKHAYVQNGPIADKRHIITHLQLVKPEHIEEFGKLGIIACINPYWHFKDDYYYNLQEPYLGKERAEHEYPVKSFIKAGAKVVSASDFPVTVPINPLEGIQIGVLRTVPNGGTGKMSYGSANDSNKEKYLLPLWPEEAASIKEMIKSFTINAAYSVFRENITGSLEEGKNADMVILEKNIQDIPCEEICNVRVMQTIHKGKVVYKR